jgi:hypothetical protein
VGITDWLRWPRLWYATPTFVLFIALQAPHWRFTGRVYIALLIWTLMGVAIDSGMNSYRWQPGPTFRRKDISWLMNGGAAFGIILGFCGLVFRPPPDSVGHLSSAPVLNEALEQLGIFLPALDIFHRELLESGQLDYAAYLGSFFVLVVVTWLAGFFLLYRAFACLPQTEFAEGIAAKKSYGRGPYGESQQKLALRSLKLTAALLPVTLLMFGRVIPMDASHPAQSGVSIVRTYLVLGAAGWVINIFIYAFHSCRRFLSTLLPGGLLVTEETYRDERH